MSNTEVKRLTFAAIDPYLEQNIVTPVERKHGNRVDWGELNKYPDYLWDLYLNVTTLQTIVEGSAKFVAGDDVIATRRINGDAPRKMVQALGLDSFLYGGRCYQIIRSRDGGIAETHPLPVRYIRSDEDNESFYYSEKWGKGARDCVVYPKFYPFKPEEWARLSDEEKNRHASSILFVKNVGAGTYPISPVQSAVKDCEIERGIADYHLNALENCFTGSVLVNFNQGKPTQEVQEEIERDMTEKFSGHQNAMRMMFSWNESKDTMTTITPLKVENFGERYDALSKFSRQQIFTAYRAIPALFGLMNESTGFSEQEFSEAFKLYNRTAIRPVQRDIADEFKYIYGEEVLTIRPFTLEGAEQSVQ